MDVRVDYAPDEHDETIDIYSENEDIATVRMLDSGYMRIYGQAGGTTRIVVEASGGKTAVTKVNISLPAPRKVFKKILRHAPGLVNRISILNTV